MELEKGPQEVRGKNSQGSITKVQGKGNFKTEVLQERSVASSGVFEEQAYRFDSEEVIL